MHDEELKTASEQPDPQLVATVTAVVQALSNAKPSEEAQTHLKNEKNAPKTIDLVGLMFHILEKFWLVLILAVVFAAFFGYRTRNAVPTYTATAKLYIVNANSPSINFADLQLGTVLTLDYQEVFRTWEVHEMVKKELGLGYSYEYMQSLITVSNPEDTRLLYITARFHDAQMAADIANAYAKAAKEFITKTMRGDAPSDFSVALVPGYAHVTSKSGAVIKGFLLGSVLAVGILTLMFVLDDRPRTPEDIQQFGGIPTLAILPSTKEAKRLSKKKYGYGKSGRGKR